MIKTGIRERIKTHTFFNLGTQRALYENTSGYINKEYYIQEYIAELKKKYNLTKIYRFDLGQNNDGCDIEVANAMEDLPQSKNKRKYIKNYPVFICSKIRKKIAALHNIFSEWILISAGLEQMISMIASAFLEVNDRIMINYPSFFLFEKYSKKMGAIPITLRLKEENNFNWTKDTLDEYKRILDRLKPKLIWLANPNNPTGLLIPDDFIEEIIKEAADHYCFIIMDEAYGEYMDSTDRVYSCSSLLHKYNNLIVLRTFSKAYGLANLRIAYAMTSDKDILRALKIHSTNFPITQISFSLACIALERIKYIETTRREITKRRRHFTCSLEKIPDMSYINSQTNIMMIKHKELSSDALIHYLEKHGIIVARLQGDDESVIKYIRITIGKVEENIFFLKVLKKLNISKIKNS